ncbi:MAG: tetratricopeptide repeat protein [Deltaproteobacteria bacterium]|nr:tetratricopeptide repeat protein [Deltaproteobacteria bacterium]MBN2670330.1 tetratricopeptide repeat protein [Deltaproteobacteria bacterium]
MDGSNELRKIEKEIIEARALIIKSNNLTNSLSSDVRSIAKRQSAYERNLSASSFVVYLIIAVLAVIGAQLAYNARQAPLEKELAQVKDEAQKAKAALAEMKKETGTEEKQGDKDLVEIYRLINEGDRQGTLDAFEKVNTGQLTYLERKLLTDVVQRFRNDLSMEHYVKALDLSAQEKYPEAVQEYKECLRYNDDAGHAKAAKIEMANALRLQGKPREAIAILQKVTEEHLNRELSDDALWYLAKSHEDAHQKDEALSVLKALMRRHPESQYFRNARVRAAELRLHMWRDDKED